MCLVAFGWSKGGGRIYTLGRSASIVICVLREGGLEKLSFRMAFIKGARKEVALGGRVVMSRALFSASSHTFAIYLLDGCTVPELAAICLC